jgi:hypothetical protein
VLVRRLLLMQMHQTNQRRYDDTHRAVFLALLLVRSMVSSSSGRRVWWKRYVSVIREGHLISSNLSTLKTLNIKRRDIFKNLVSPHCEKKRKKNNALSENKNTCS